MTKISNRIDAFIFESYSMTPDFHSPSKQLSVNIEIDLKFHTKIFNTNPSIRSIQKHLLKTSIYFMVWC